MKRSKFWLTLLIGCILGYSFAVFMPRNPTLPEYMLSGEFDVSFVTSPPSEPYGYAKYGELENGLDTPVYVLSILDDIGQRARVTLVGTARKMGQYCEPGNLVVHLNDLEDGVYNALLLSGDGLHFTFENRPQDPIRVRYVVLDKKSPRFIRELVVELPTP